MTSLHKAAAQGNIKAVKYFILKGAKINAMLNIHFHTGDTWKMTPLHLAAYYGHTELVRVLKEFGADFTMKSEYNNLKGGTAFEIANDNNHFETATECFVKNSFDSKEQNEQFDLAIAEDNSDIIDKLYESGLLSVKAGERALRHAAEKGAVKVVETLLKYKINPNAYAHVKPLCHVIDIEHKTPLGIAAENSQYQIAKLLLENGARVDQVTHSSIYQKDCTPLRMALVHVNFEPSNPALIALLLQHHADIKKINELGLSMLTVKGKVDEIELLLKAGLDPNGKPEGTSHLSNAIFWSFRDPCAALLFIKYGANIHELDSFGKTYLYKTENITVLKKLIEKGLDVNAKDYYGKTPLQYVTNKEVAEFLVEKGADYSVLDPSSDLVRSNSTCTLFKTFSEAYEDDGDVVMQCRVSLLNKNSR